MRGYESAELARKCISLLYDLDATSYGYMDAIRKNPENAADLAAKYFEVRKEVEDKHHGAS